MESMLNNFHCLCRSYGSWVSRNPTFVLFSSVAIVLVLCVGLVRFKVETRPEKVLYFSLFFILSCKKGPCDTDAPIFTYILLLSIFIITFDVISILSVFLYPKERMLVKH